MTARLIVTNGPLKGELYSLDEDPVTIGRDLSNHISLDDALVSRYHSVIESESGRYRIVDRESRNGVLVNDESVTERVLEHGDTIRIGDATMLFLAEEDPSLVSASWFEERGEEPPRGPLVQLKPDETLFFRPDELAASTTMGDQRTVRELGALVKLGVAVVGCRDTESLHRLLVECVFGSIPAERAAILLRNDESDAFAPVYGRDRAGGVTHPIRVSQTIVDYVTLEGVAVLAKDVSVDELVGSDEDLAASGVHSVLAVPFVIREKKLGVLYLESGRGETHFDDENLHFASAVVEIGAAATEHVRFVEGLGERS